MSRELNADRGFWRRPMRGGYGVARDLFLLLGDIIFHPFWAVADFMRLTQRDRGDELPNPKGYMLLGALVGVLVGAGVFLALFYLTPVFAGIGAGIGGIATLAAIGYGLAVAGSILVKSLAVGMWKISTVGRLDSSFEGARSKVRERGDLSVSLSGTHHSNWVKNGPTYLGLNVFFSALWNVFFNPLATFFNFFEDSGNKTSRNAALGSLVGIGVGVGLFILLFSPISPLGIVNLGTTALVAIGYGMTLLFSILFKGIGVAVAGEENILTTTVLGNTVNAVALYNGQQVSLEDHQSLASENMLSSTSQILTSQGGSARGYSTTNLEETDSSTLSDSPVNDTSSQYTPPNEEDYADEEDLSDGNLAPPPPQQHR